MGGPIYFGDVGFGQPPSQISLGFGVIDHVTVMLLFIASLLAHQHLAIGYMNTDPINDNRNHRQGWFVLFCSGMLWMVLADSFLWLFIFWELMVCVHLLIGSTTSAPAPPMLPRRPS